MSNLNKNDNTDDVLSRLVDSVANENSTNQNLNKEQKPKSVKNKLPNNKKEKVWRKVMAIAMSVLILVLTFTCGVVLSPTMLGQDAMVANFIVDVINDHSYLVQGEVTAGDLMKYGISGVLNDPYAYIFTPEETSALNASYIGSNKSIGMTVGEYENTQGIYVIKLIRGSSAEKSGMVIGARLLSINGNDTTNMKTPELTEIITAIADDTDIAITFSNPTRVGNSVIYDLENPQEAIVKRTEYIEEVVRYYDCDTEGLEGTLDEDTAIIGLYSFMGDVKNQFDKAMQTFYDNGKTNLILDLRDNSGGADYNLQAVANHLLNGEKKKNLILSQKYKDGSTKDLYTTDNFYDKYNFNKIIVLVNNNSASASEALLLAMKDYETVDKIIGQTTYGKGSGLATYTMPITNYSVRFIDSYFFSPLGNTNEGTGIEPTAGYGMEQNITTNVPYKMYLDNVIIRATNALKS